MKVKYFINLYILLIILIFISCDSENDKKISTPRYHGYSIKEVKIKNSYFNILKRSFGANVTSDNKLDTSNGYFLKIDLTVANHDSDLLIFGSTNFELSDDFGVVYPFSKSAENMFSGFETSFWHIDVDPHQEKEGFLIFNVPHIQKYQLHLYDKAKDTNSALIELENY